jgi:integrase
MKLKGNQKGEAVLTSDPEKGPLTDMEYQGIIDALNDKFAKDEISMEDFLLVWLFMATGRRSVQLAALKVRDFLVTRTPSGAERHYLQVPRAKQRYQSPRSEFRRFRIISDLGKVIEEYLSLLQVHADNLDLPASELPFWINAGNKDAPSNLKYHCTSEELAKRVEAVFDVLNVYSERTGRAIKITTRRFRYTIGTRAAGEGASELVLAELLDHNDTQNVGVYVAALPEIVDRIDRAMAIHLAPLAQAFAGKLIDNEGLALRGSDPRSRIVMPGNFSAPVGSCGEFGFCKAIAPLACYTCRDFQPWLDGPHEEVLQSLLQTRDRILEETEDIKIASINDRTIFACAGVILQCESRRSMLGMTK